jgi:hypothetical protein
VERLGGGIVATINGFPLVLLQELLTGELLRSHLIKQTYIPQKLLLSLKACSIVETLFEEQRYLTAKTILRIILNLTLTMSKKIKVKKLEGSSYAV